MKTVKTLFIFASVVFIGIALGGCDEAQQMVPPTVEGGGGDTTTPPVESPADDNGDEAAPADGDGGEDTTTDRAGDEAAPADGADGEEATADGDGDEAAPTDGDGGEEATVENPPPVVPEGTVVSIMPASVTSPAVGEQLTVEIQVAGAENVFGYELTLMFDATALRYVESANGDYLPGAFFVPSLKNDNEIAIYASGAGTKASGTLATVTFEVVSRQASTLTLANVLLSDADGVNSEPHVVNAEISE